MGRARIGLPLDGEEDLAGRRLLVLELHRAVHSLARAEVQLTQIDRAVAERIVAEAQPVVVPGVHLERQRNELLKAAAEEEVLVPARVEALFHDLRLVRLLA